MWSESNCTQGIKYISTWTSNADCNSDKMNKLKKTKDKDTKTKERQHKKVHARIKPNIDLVMQPMVSVDK